MVGVVNVLIGKSGLGQLLKDVERSVDNGVEEESFSSRVAGIQSCSSFEEN